MKFKGGKDAWDLEPAFQEQGASIARRRSNALSLRRPQDAASPGASQSLVHHYWRFVLAGITNHSQTGAIVPSQRFLIDRMIAPIPADYRGEIVELGAGTGALTLRLAESCPAARILACEINPVLAREVETRTRAAGLSRRVRVTSTPAEVLLSKLRQHAARPPDFIVSGIPLGNLVKERAASLIGLIHGALVQGGMYIQFQYSLIDRKKVKLQFSRLRTGLVLLNFPPAFVYYAWK